MAILVNDTFTEAGDTALTAHTPDTGTGWTEEDNSTGSSLNILSGRGGDNVSLTATGGEAHIAATAQPNPTAASYDVEITFKEVQGAGGQDDPCFLIARFTDGSNFYSAGTYATDDAADKRIFKMVSGSPTELASGDNGLANTDKLSFEVRTDTPRLRLLHNDSSVLTSDDTAITAVGRAGFGLGNYWDAAVDDARHPYQITLFTLTEVDPVYEQVSFRFRNDDGVLGELA